MDSISDRVTIRSSIQKGDVQTAIEKVNDLNPEVSWSTSKQYTHLFKILDKNPKLYFQLKQQQLIELIREGKIDEALQFAQEELAPRGEENVSLC